MMRPRQAPLPVLAPRDAPAPLAWVQGRPISAAQFMAHAHAIAGGLPEGQPINLCQDRLQFALGLVAALLRHQLSLLPPNALPETLRQVPAGSGPVYALVDGDVPGLDALPTHRMPPLPPVRPDPTGPAVEMPLLAADLPAVCLLTSGSTGAPQPHAKRWGPLVSNIRAEAQRLAQMLGQDSLAGLTVVATVPAQHSYGLESSVLLALLGGAAFEAGRPFYPADIVQSLAAVPRPRALVTTPFHLKALLLSGVDLPPVDLVLSATAPLSPQMAAQAEAALGGVLVEIYGCTEAGQVASRRTTQGEVWTTLGDLRLHHEAAADADANSQRCVVSGGHVLEPTPLADVLELLDSQRFRLLGRANDLIHVAGKRSSLAHLNFHLNRIDGVDDGAFWLPDELAEGVVRPVAFVVAPRRSAADIVAALRGLLEPAFVPRRVLHVAALPREATGKLTAAALRQFALETLAQAAAPAPAVLHADRADRADWASLADRAADGTLTRLFQVDARHPALAGHFPGHPVLPGVVLLSWVMDTVASDREWARLLGPAPRVDNAKFLAPVLPRAPAQPSASQADPPADPLTEPLTLALRLVPQGSGVAFEFHRLSAGVAGPCMARGQLAPGPAP
jgi:acyl-CoA synthetase (AMP-forming)/AMP-acid ligase II